MGLRSFWQRYQARRAQRFLTANPEAALTVLRQDPSLAAVALHGLYANDAAFVARIDAMDAARKGPERETFAYPVLNSMGFGGRQPLQRTLPKISPWSLRRFSEYPPARRAINAIKLPILDLPFSISLKKPVGARRYDADPEPTEEQHARIAAATDMLVRPNNEYTGREFLELLLEDLLVLGGGVFEDQQNRSDTRPLLLWAVDSQSVRVNVQWTPGSKEFRYSQGRGYLFGAAGTTDDVKLQDDELCYIKLNSRTSTPFGLGYLEVAFSCYSADMEVLTRRGWIPWPEACDIDEFATRHPQTGVFEWQRPSAMHKAAHTGEMIYFHSQSTDVCVTPNHRMFGRQVHRDKAWRRRGDSSIAYDLMGFLDAESVASLRQPMKGMSPFQVPTRSLWHGAESEKYVMLSCVGGLRGKKPESYRVLLEDWIAFLGIYVAEGSAFGTKSQHTDEEKRAARQYQVYISQAKDSSHRNAIRELLLRLPFRWREIENGFYCTSKALHTAVFPLGNSYEKYVPALVKEAIPSLIRSFIEWACMGDGSIRPGGLITYGTTSKRLADDMQELFQKSGSAASVSCYDGKPGPLPGGRYCETPVPMYYVLEQSSEFDGIGKADRILYDGYVYCASVPNEVLYVRRNGKALWCGNTVNAFIGSFEYAERRASNSTPNYLIFMGENATPEQVTRFRHYWENDVEGFGKVPITGGGRAPGVHPLSGTGEDPLWLKWQEFLIRVVAMSFGISPMRLGLERDVNRSTSEQGAADDWATIAPIANTVREAITHWLLWKRLGWTDLEFAWQIKTADELKQATILAEQYDMNGITVDEIRQIYERPPLEDGLGDMTKTAYEAAIKAAAGLPAGTDGNQEQTLITPFDDEADNVSPEAAAFLRELMQQKRRERPGLRAVAG